jgi:Tfp pilus assembly protein PilO
MALLPTNQRDQILLVACIVSLGLVYVYYEYLWTPKSEQLALMQARVDTLVATNKIAQQEVARGTAGKLKAEAEEYGRMLGIMRQLVPVANEVPTLLDQISTAARRTGLDLADVTPLGVIGGQIFDTYRYRIGVSGPYHRIAKFLDNIVAPMNLSVFPSGRPNQRARAGERLLDASFEIQTYVAKTAAPAVPGAGSQGQ